VQFWLLAKNGSLSCGTLKIPLLSGCDKMDFIIKVLFHVWKAVISSDGGFECSKMRFCAPHSYNFALLEEIILLK
jgi:hypothetical protein